MSAKGRLARHPVLGLGTLAARVLGGVVRRERIANAVVFVTDQCNATCAHCFNTSLAHIGSAERDGSRRTLDVGEYRVVARHLRGLVQVMFGGGEPFLRRELGEIAAAFVEEAGAKLLSLPTNGTIPGTAERVEEIATRLPSATVNLQISLDAVGARHDELRGLPGGFDKAIALGRELLEVGRRRPNINVVVSTAVTEQNVDDVPRLAVHLRTALPGLRYHNVQVDQRLDAHLAERPELLRKIAEIGRRHAAPPGADRFERLLHRGYVGFVNGLILEQLGRRRMLYRCNAGRKLCVILPDGRVAPCEPFVFEDHYATMPKLDLRDHDLDYYRLAANRRYMDMLRFIAGGRCTACPWSCATISSLTYSPRNWGLVLTVGSGAVFSRPGE